MWRSNKDGSMNDERTDTTSLRQMMGLPRGLTNRERDELAHLTNLWNCTEPMTPAQIARMEELDVRLRGMRVELPKGEASASEGRKYNGKHSDTAQ